MVTHDPSRMPISKLVRSRMRTTQRLAQRRRRTRGTILKSPAVLPLPNHQLHGRTKRRKITAHALTPPSGHPTNPQNHQPPIHMKLLALAASTSSTSINRQLANYAAHLIPDAQVTELNLRDYQLPIYSDDEEKQNGIPADAQKFLTTIQEHDAIVISMAEHNGSYAAAFKNLYDWTSRIDQKLWSQKPMLLLATSPGPGGAKFVLDTAKSKFPRMGADLKATFSLPAFHENFDETGITNPDLAEAFQNALRKFYSTL